jgi:hypothetical protein
MNRTTTLFLGSFALAGAACSQSLQPMMGIGTGGSGAGYGTGGVGVRTPQTAEILLASSSTGFVADPVSGVTGAWYSYGDGVGPNANPTNGGNAADSDCQSKGGFPPSDCSQIAAPTPGEPFAPTNAAISQMCTKGTAAQVLLKGGSPDYADLWGAGIGLNFNSPGADAGPPGYFDMTPYKGIAFDFTADELPAQSMRVCFPFQGMHAADAPYWMGATMSASPLTGTTASPQHVEIDWPDVGGPLYLSQETPPIDAGTFPLVPPRAVQAIQFQVFTNAQVTTPYSFCVANLALVPN